MYQVTLDKPGHFTFDDHVSPPTPSSGEALVRVRRIGVCGTDLHAFAGRQPFFNYPRILGHELAVEVLEVNDGPLSRIHAGDRCAVEPYLACNQCGACRRGKTQCCENLRVMGVHVDGGMREMIVVPTSHLHPNANLSLDQLALMETLCIGAHAVERAQTLPDETCLVLGTGPIGLSVIQCLQAAGARVIAADINDARLTFTRDTIGVEHTLNPQHGEMEPRLRALCEGDLPTAVFDATGHPASMMGTFDQVAFGGRIVFVGLFMGDVTFRDPNFHRREITLLATRNATAATFTQVMAWVESGQLRTDPWITHRMKLTDVPTKFATIATQPGLIKAMIESDA